jgi:Ca2+-binding RTX toxin-like protein
MKVVPIILVALAASLAPATLAHGATVSVGGTAGPSGEEFIQFKAGKGEANRVLVNFRPTSITIVDRGVGRIRLDRSARMCRRSGDRRVVCMRERVPGGNYVFLPVFLVLGDRNDTARFAPGADSSDRRQDDPLAVADSYEDTEGAIVEATNVDAGPGDDIVTGTKYADVIAPGTGRDRVEGRAGDDDILLTPDGRTDSLKAGGGIDGLNYSFATAVPVTVDLTAGVAGAAGERDRALGFEQAHGGSKDDVLLGSGDGEALYGEAGRDRVEGREGDDMVVGDSPLVSTAFVNEIAAGPGDDVVDARSQGHTDQFDPRPQLAPTTSVDCGPGNDIEAGDVDDRLDPSCEAAAFRIPEEYLPVEEPFYDAPMRVAPASRAADGSPVFEVPCPAKTRPQAAGCTGKVVVERPPVPGSSASPEELGSGSFSLPPGGRTNVEVTLNAAGRAAVSQGSVVAVHVTATLPPPPGDDWGGRVLSANFGWQTVLGP